MLDRCNTFVCLKGDSAFLVSYLKSQFVMFLSFCQYLHREVQKAVDCFLKVPLDIASEDFLCELVMVEDSQECEPRMIYYLKVLNLLEQFHYPHMAVSVAKNAISVCSENADILVSEVYTK